MTARGSTEVRGFTGRLFLRVSEATLGLFRPSSMKDKDYITARAAHGVTGLRNNYSLQSFRDSSDLESLAPAMSLWPPNASPLFCQKEVLMLLR